MCLMSQQCSEDSINKNTRVNTEPRSEDWKLRTATPSRLRGPHVYASYGGRDILEKKSPQAILKAEQSKDFDVDEFLEPSDVLSRQLLDLVAEENAYDDCIELLSNALQERSIATEDWLFEVRDCYKKQFFCRELQKKVVRVLKARKLAKATTGL